MTFDDPTVGGQWSSRYKYVCGVTLGVILGVTLWVIMGVTLEGMLAVILGVTLEGTLAVT